ncbi:MAG: DUF2760 domain-containing protein [Victivallales bacterium]|nr:DUF2760 domain-containing protein [Victivallales bacterium]
MIESVAQEMLNMGKLGDAFKAFWSVWRGPSRSANGVTVKALEETEAESSLRTGEKKLSVTAKDNRESFENGALYTLALLQREGRLIDFLMESIDSYEDNQIGAAVRRIHASCRRALQEYYQIRRIVETPEGGAFEVDAKMDHSRIRLVGNIPDMVPFKGVVQHCGWEAVRLDLPERHSNVNTRIIYPAEVGF